LSHMWMSHVTRVYLQEDERASTYAWVMPRVRMSQVTRMNELWNAHQIRHVTAHDWLGTRIRDMAHPYAWLDAFTCVTSLLHMCDMPHSRMGHAAFTCVTWRIYMCGTAHSPPPPHWIRSTEILFENIQIFHDILLNFTNIRGGGKACRFLKKESKPSEIT